MEAGYGNESLSFLRKYAPKAERKMVAESFLRQGKLQGSEYADLTTDHSFVLWGVEDLKLYAKSVSLYRSIVKEREKFKDYLNRIEAAISISKPKIYNPFLLTFDEKYQKFQKGETSLTDYFEILAQEAGKLGNVLHRYPSLDALNQLRVLEKKIGFQKANEEQQKAIASLSPEDQKELIQASKENHSPFKLSSHENQVERAFFCLLEEKIKGYQTDYPELFKYLDYLKEAKKINAKSVLEEQKRLEKEIFQALITNSDEETLVRASYNVGSLKKLLTLTLTPDEFEEYRKDKQAFDITRITGFLNKKIMDFRTYYDKAVFLETGYEDTIQKCEQFYSLTYQRDKKFIENLLPVMEGENQEKAVLITGGYHSPNLKYLLKQQNISYIVLMPQILQDTNQKRYEAILLGQMDELKKSINQGVIKPIASTNMDPRIGREAVAAGLAVPPDAINILEQRDLRFAEGTGVIAGARMATKGRGSARWQKLRIFDKNNNLMGEHTKIEISNMFARLDDVVIRGLSLQKSGGLFVAGRMWIKFANHPNAPVEFDVKNGLVSEVRILNPDGQVIQVYKPSGVYDQQDRLIGVFYGATMLADKFRKLDDVTIKNVRLGNRGGLFIGGRSWVSLSSYPGAPVEFDVKKGLVVKVRILNETGEVIKTYILSTVHNQQGHIVDVFYNGIPSAKLRELGNVTVKDFSLNSAADLSVGERIWASFPSHPNAPGEFDVENGLVIQIRVLDELDNVLELHQPARIYDSAGHLIDVFYGGMSAGRFRKYDNVTIKNFHLDNIGRLSVGGRIWAKFPYPNALVEIDIKNGLVTKIQILDEVSHVRETHEFSRVYDSAGHLVDVFYWKISPSKFRKFKNSTVRNFSLDNTGRFIVAGRTWFKLETYPNAPVEFDVQDGLVTELRVLDRMGQVVGTYKLSRIYDQEGRLLDVFYNSSSDKFSQLDNVTIKSFQLGAVGSLSIGGKRWKTFGSYPGAEVEIEVKNGQIWWLRFVQDRHGRPIDYRNTGFGKFLGQDLFGKQVAFYEKLKEALQQHGISQAQAEVISDMLVRLRGSSIYLLYTEGLISEDDVQAFSDMNINRLNIPKLAEKLKEALRIYQEKGLNNDFINKLLSAHLLPWTFIERLQRTYRLGQDTVLIYQALNHPNVEAWIKRIRQAQEERGTLNKQKHLTRYNPLSMPLRSGPKRLELVNHLRAQAHLIDTIIKRKISTDLPFEKQLERLEAILNNLERSGNQTTGIRALDRLLGLRSLTQSQIPTISFFDQDIPYLKFSDYESKGDEAQETAVKLAVGSTEVLYMEGPPGTGKTKVIAEILRQAVNQDKRVLLVSQMHQAVDNALSAVMDDSKIPVLRLGSDPHQFRYGTRKVWAGNRDTGLWEEGVSTFEARHRRQKGYVVAATDMGIATDWAIRRERLEDLISEGFDIVIMDEASRETLAGALVPLSYVKQDGKIILVGDQKQLPPFGLTDEQSAKLLEAGISRQDVDVFNKSFFEWLLENPGGERIMLSTNYRSHPLIAGLVSELFYEGDIHRRGWEDFDAETLSLRVIDVADESDEYYEQRTGTSFQNLRSADQVIKLVQLYVSRGVPMDEITIITPYKPQVDLLERKLRETFRGTQNRPIVTTIDSYQGGENKVIIFDFVRSNPNGKIGFVKDLRRLNVGLSRAQENLAIVWDSRTFTSQPSINDTLEDQTARQFFQHLQGYYSNEVETFFETPEELSLPNGARMAENSIIGSLIDDLKIQNVEVNLKASDALVKIGIPAIPDLINLLRYLDSDPRYLAANILRVIGPAAQGALSDLKTALSRDHHLSAQMAMIEAINAIDPSTNLKGAPVPFANLTFEASFRNYLSEWQRVSSEAASLVTTEHISLEPYGKIAERIRLYLAQPQSIQEDEKLFLFLLNRYQTFFQNYKTRRDIYVGAIAQQSRAIDAATGGEKTRTVAQDDPRRISDLPAKFRTAAVEINARNLIHHHDLIKAVVIVIAKLSLRLFLENCRFEEGPKATLLNQWLKDEEKFILADLLLYLGNIRSKVLFSEISLKGLFSRFVADYYQPKIRLEREANSHLRNQVEGLIYPGLVNFEVYGQWFTYRLRFERNERNFISRIYLDLNPRGRSDTSAIVDIFADHQVNHEGLKKVLVILREFMRRELDGTVLLFDDDLNRAAFVVINSAEALQALGEYDLPTVITDRASPQYVEAKKFVEDQTQATQNRVADAQLLLDDLTPGEEWPPNEIEQHRRQLYGFEGAVKFVLSWIERPDLSSEDILTARDEAQRIRKFSNQLYYDIRTWAHGVDYEFAEELIKKTQTAHAEAEQILHSRSGLLEPDKTEAYEKRLLEISDFIGGMQMYLRQGSSHDYVKTLVALDGTILELEAMYEEIKNSGARMAFSPQETGFQEWLEKVVAISKKEFSNYQEGHFRSHADMLERRLYHLLANAYDAVWKRQSEHTEAGYQPRIDLEIILTKEGHLQIAVEDNGIGIDNIKVIQRLFEERVSTKERFEKEYYGGWGEGLYLLTNALAFDKGTVVIETKGRTTAFRKVFDTNSGRKEILAIDKLDQGTKISVSFPLSKEKQEQDVVFFKETWPTELPNGARMAHTDKEKLFDWDSQVLFPAFEQLRKSNFKDWNAFETTTNTADLPDRHEWEATRELIKKKISEDFGKEVPMEQILFALIEMINGRWLSLHDSLILLDQAPSGEWLLSVHKLVQETLFAELAGQRVPIFFIYQQKARYQVMWNPLIDAIIVNLNDINNAVEHDFKAGSVFSGTPYPAKEFFRQIHLDNLFREELRHAADYIRVEQASGERYWVRSPNYPTHYLSLLKSRKMLHAMISSAYRSPLLRQIPEKSLKLLLFNGIDELSGQLTAGSGGEVHAELLMIRWMRNFISGQNDANYRSNNAYIAMLFGIVLLSKQLGVIHSEITPEAMSDYLANGIDPGLFLEIQSRPLSEIRKALGDVFAEYYVSSLNEPPFDQPIRLGDSISEDQVAPKETTSVRTFDQWVKKLDILFKGPDKSKVVEVQFRGPIQNLSNLLKIAEEKPESFYLDSSGMDKLREVLGQYQNQQGSEAVASVNEQSGTNFNWQEFLAVTVYFIEQTVQGARLASATDQKIYGITGGSGSVGTQLIRQLLAQSDTKEIYVLTRKNDSETLQKLAADHPKVHLVEGDLLNVKALTRLVDNSDVVYHLGGWSGLGKISPQEALAVNGLSTALLSQLTQEKQKRLVFASTVHSYMLSQKKEGVVAEKDLVLPADIQAQVDTHYKELKDTASKILTGETTEVPTFSSLPQNLSAGPSLYSFTKLLGEKLIADYPQALTLRFSNVYGPGDETDRAVPKFVREMAKATPEDQKTFIPGRQNAYIYVDDLVQALHAVANVAITDSNRVINVTDAVPVTQEDLFLKIKEVTNSPAQVAAMSQEQMQKLGLVAPPPLTFDTTLMQQELGLAPEQLTDLRKGLEKTKQWLLDSSTEDKWKFPSDQGARLATESTALIKRLLLQDDFLVGIRPKPGRSMAVSPKAGEPSILTFKEGKNSNLIDVYVGGEYFKTIDATRKIKNEISHISVAEMIQVLREVDQKYNRELASELQSVPIEAYIYLDSYKDLPEDLQRSMITTELVSLVTRSANYKAIHFVGSDEMVRKTRDVFIPGVRALKAREGLFVEGAKALFPKEANQIHLLTKRDLLNNPDIRKDPKNRFITLQDIKYDKEKRTVDIIAFNPVASLFELVGAINNLSKNDSAFDQAYDLFKEITGFDLTKEDFIGFLEGRPDLVERFALPPAIRAIDVNLALKVWAMAARMASQAA